MNNVLNGLFSRIRQILRALSNPSAPLQILAPRALLIVYDPVVALASGQRLSQFKGWNRVEDLVADYIADIEECSGGLVKYRVVQRLDVDEFPLKADGVRYDASSYLDVLGERTRPHDPDLADYHQIMADYNLLERAANGDFDEVWLFGGPYFGFWEAAMAGTGAFFCNGGPVPNSPCRRKFVMMGFSYERGVGEMIEDLGHRAETTLAHLFGSDDFWVWAYDRNRTPKTTDVGKLNLLERFLCFDQIAPGKSNVGTLHYAPNSTTDYEWGATTLVRSCADDWDQFPDLPNPPNYRTMTTQDWGGGDIRAHHKWWLKRLPKVAGRTNGISNNWWKYFIDPNNVA